MATWCGRLSVLASFIVLLRRCETQPAPPIDRLSFGNPYGAYDSGEIPGWEFGGDAFLTEDYLALTPPSQNKIGYVWTNERVRASDLEAELELHIGGVAKRGAGGGLAFWLTGNKGTNGSIYGHDESYHGLGLLFDTYEGDDPTSNEPFVVAMVNQGADLGADGKATYASKQVRRARTRARERDGAERGPEGASAGRVCKRSLAHRGSEPTVQHALPR